MLQWRNLSVPILESGDLRGIVTTFGLGSYRFHDIDSFVPVQVSELDGGLRNDTGFHIQIRIIRAGSHIIRTLLKIMQCAKLAAGNLGKKSAFRCITAIRKGMMHNDFGVSVAVQIHNLEGHNRAHDRGHPILHGKEKNELTVLRVAELVGVRDQEYDLFTTLQAQAPLLADFDSALPLQ